MDSDIAPGIYISDSFNMG